MAHRERPSAAKSGRPQGTHSRSAVAGRSIAPCVADGETASHTGRMRLIGYACSGPEPPLLDVYVPLAPLTVLLGPNDAGKSSLLRAVERDLEGGHYAAINDDDLSRLMGGAFYATAGDDEFDNLITQCVGI